MENGQNCDNIPPKKGTPVNSHAIPSTFLLLLLPIFQSGQWQGQMLKFGERHLFVRTENVVAYYSTYL